MGKISGNSAKLCCIVPIGKALTIHLGVRDGSLGSDLSIPSRCLDQTSQTVKPGGLVARGQPCQASSQSSHIFFGRFISFIFY